MKSNISILFLALLITACGGPKSSSEISAEIDRVVEVYGARLPIKLTDIESLTKVGKENDTTLELTYTWQETANLMYDNVEEDLRELLIEDFDRKKDKELTKLVEIGANFRYNYQDRDGNKIVSILVTPKDYKKEEKNGK